MISQLAQEALNELGVPGPETPAPVANAIEKLKEIKEISDYYRDAVNTVEKHLLGDSFDKGDTHIHITRGYIPEAVPEVP